MRNFLKKLSHKNTEQTRVKKVDTSIPNQRPDIFLSDLKNLKYSISSIWEPEDFIYDGKSFENQNLYNRVVIYGRFFECLYDDYLERLTCKIQNWRLPSSGYFPKYPWDTTPADMQLYKRDERPYITDGAYEKMPKRYRGVFKKYNSITYVLNTHAEPYKIFIVKQENRPEMEALLLKMAEILDNNKVCLRGSGFVEDSSPDANKVTKEQIDATKEMYDICVKLNSITEPGFKRSVVHAGENQKQRHGALDIYNEYTSELSQKNRYLKLQEKINSAKQKRDSQQQEAVSQYNTTRSTILANAKKQITR